MAQPRAQSQLKKIIAAALEEVSGFALKPRTITLKRSQLMTKMEKNVIYDSGSIV